ncbi:proteasome subunit beta type-3-like, partial [Homarus americanus]|uniref:proteasome subunit beta type-3-like n=1 Tax=Homarus americanus TaxID=6706 RepID=UPI001C493744
EGRRMKPQTLMAMVQNLLYERRFGPYFVEPVIAGLHPNTKEPYICALDLIGCPCEPADFVVSGTCSESLYGMYMMFYCLSDGSRSYKLIECNLSSIIIFWVRDKVTILLVST